VEKWSRLLPQSGQGKRLSTLVNRTKAHAHIVRLWAVTIRPAQWKVQQFPTEKLLCNMAYFCTKDKRNAKGLPQRAAETDRREKPGRRGGKKKTGLGGEWE